ncbi:tyrosine-type recombinase/integrase [Crateriforma conspicua]|uniref:tyrosine-type recombinase/integrase n=1 Tax=Crateriforma conspicua TaxID=2527996 RepID=UPI0018CF7E63|nr:tyrosine-type recombinase/integrase [Crateriforma conspicua]
MSSRNNYEQRLTIQAAASCDRKVQQRVGDIFATSFQASGGSSGASTPAEALVPWICDVLLSAESVKAYGRDIRDFVDYMNKIDVNPLSVTADHVRLYKGAMVKSGLKATTIARRLSVLRGVYCQLAEKGFVDWQDAQRFATIKAPPVAKNTTPALTAKQAGELLAAVPGDTLKGIRDLALLQTFFITGCRVSAVVRACVGHLETDGVEHYLRVVEKRNKQARKILLSAAPAIRRYIGEAGIQDDIKGPLFRPMSPDHRTFQRRHMNRSTPWRLVKYYCRRAGIDPGRLGGRGIGVHSLRKTAITDAICNGAGMHEVREFAGHVDIRTTELYYQRTEEDAASAARRISIQSAE